MADATDLPSAIRIVRAALAETGKQRARPPSAGGGITAWHDRHRKAMAALGQDLARQLDARITERWDGARVRICGISASSTSGLSGALQNWLVAAEKRVRGASEG